MLLTAFLLFFGSGAQAAITCNASSPGFSAYYVPADPINVTQSTVTVSCTRGSVADAASLTFNVAVNNGLYTAGNPNQARRGGAGGAANRITYDTYKNSGCTTLWTGTGLGRISGTITFIGTSLSAATTTSWWGCITSGQTGKNSGTFTDSVRMTLTLSTGTPTPATSQIAVSIVHPVSCTIAPAPATLVFNYTSLGGASNASTNFGANCTNGMPYTMALDAYGGTLLGLNYTLVLNGGTLGMTGTGAVQTIPIAGSIAAGQAGTCATATCNAVQGHTLTITY
jgi:spore coat protein U-like protein